MGYGIQDGLANRGIFIRGAVVCPSCRGGLAEAGDGAVCSLCGSVYKRNVYGYIEFITDESVYDKDSTTDKYAADQASAGTRVYEEYIRPLMDREPFGRVLDVGCGVGKGVSRLVEEGFDAYGLDLPGLSRFWRTGGNDPRHFLCGDAGHIPFPDGYFDVVFSLGVIEHIGTLNGHYTLSSSYREARQGYADEVLRVTRPGGRIIVACPNKSFPIDIQHGPDDGLGPGSGLREYIFRRTGMNLHQVWGEYHLLSYGETRSLFCKDDPRRGFEPLPLKGYFGFGRFRSGFLSLFGRVAELYVNNLPTVLRESFLNPYMLAQIRK